MSTITVSYTHLVYPKGGVGIVSTFKIQKDSYNWKYNDFKIANPEQLVIYESVSYTHLMLITMYNPIVRLGMVHKCMTKLVS